MVIFITCVFTFKFKNQIKSSQKYHTGWDVVAHLPIWAALKRHLMEEIDIYWTLTMLGAISYVLFMLSYFIFMAVLSGRYY